MIATVRIVESGENVDIKVGNAMPIANIPVGTTIHKYVVKKRLNYAKKMLDEGYNVKQITKMVGFNDESHFIQTFKKEFNMTPNKYKSKNK